MLASTHQALCTCWWSMLPKAAWGNTCEPGDPQAWTTPLMWPRCLRNSSPSKTCSRVPTRLPGEWSTLHLKGYVIEGCASGHQYHQCYLHQKVFFNVSFKSSKSYSGMQKKKKKEKVIVVSSCSWSLVSALPQSTNWQMVKLFFFFLITILLPIKWLTTGY